MYMSALHLIEEKKLYAILIKAERCKPKYDMTIYFVSEIDRLLMAGGGASFEFERCYQSAKTFHAKVSQALIECWQFIADFPDKLIMLPEYARRFNAASQAATESFKILKRHWPNSRKVKNAYAEFMATIKGENSRIPEDIDNDSDISRRDSGSSSVASNPMSILNERKSSAETSGMRRMPSNYARKFSMAATGGSPSNSIIALNSGKKKLKQATKSELIKKQLEAQLRWSLDGFTTSLDISVVLFLLLLTVSVILMWAFGQAIQLELSNFASMSNIQIGLMRIGIGTRRVMISKTYFNETLTNNQYEFERYRNFLAQSSEMTLQAISSIWQSALGVPELIKILSREVDVKVRNFSGGQDLASAESIGFPLVLALANFAENGAGLSDLGNSAIKSLQTLRNQTGYLTIVEQSQYAILDNLPKGKDSDFALSVKDSFEDYSSFRLLTWADLLSALYIFIIGTICGLVVYIISFAKTGLNDLLKQQRLALNVFLCLSPQMLQTIILNTQKASGFLSEYAEAQPDISEEEKKQDEQKQSKNLNAEEQVNNKTGQETLGTAVLDRKLVAPVLTTSGSEPPVANEKEVVENQISKEQKKLFGLTTLLISTKVALLCIVGILHSNLHAGIDHVQKLDRLNVEVSSILYMIYETWIADPHNYYSRDEAASILLNQIDEVTQTKLILIDDYFVSTFDPISDFLNQSCYAWNSTICDIRNAMGGDAYRPHVATTNGLIYLLNDVIFNAEEVSRHYIHHEDMFMMLLKYLDDVGIQDLLDGLWTLQQLLIVQLNNYITYMFGIFIGVWIVAAIFMVANFFVMRSAILRVQNHFSNTWELLMLIPPLSHQYSLQLQEFVKELSAKTQANRGFFANLWGYVNGHADFTTNQLQPMKFNNKDNTNEKAESISQQYKYTGALLWLHSQFYRDLYPKGISTVQQKQIYAKRRRISEMRVGTVYVWALVICVVITGQQSGWNIAILNGGTGGLFLATLIALCNYTAIAVSLAQMQSLNPHPNSGFSRYVIHLKLGSIFPFLVGLYEIIAMITFISLIINSFSVYTKNIFSTSIYMQAVHIAILSGSLIVVMMYIEKSMWYTVLIGGIISWGVILSCGIFGAFYFRWELLLGSSSDQLQQSIHERWFPNGFHGVILSIVPALWWFTGIEWAQSVSQQLADPKRNVKLGMYSALGTLAATAILLCFTNVGVPPGAEQIANALVPVELLLQTVYGNTSGVTIVVNVILIIPALFNLVGLVIAAGQLMWSLSWIGLFPSFFSITCWEHDKAGKPPNRCYLVAIGASVFLNIAMLTNDSLSVDTSFKLYNQLLYLTISSSMCLYSLIGIVQVITSTRLLMTNSSSQLLQLLQNIGGILRGIFLVILNCFLIVYMSFYDNVWKVSIVVLAVITAIMLVYFLTIQRKQYLGVKSLNIT
ncbi:amino acid permease-domain-containing protein [Cladochytrium replicatum]|nr:amino acid permease-domain-containing protein [Cladochytrium replicatum]